MTEEIKVPQQDDFEFTERTIHDGELAKMERERSMPIPEELRVMVLDAMAHAALIARKTKLKPAKKKPVLKNPMPDDDGTPVIATLPLSNHPYPVEIRSGHALRMRAAYPDLNIEVTLKRIALDWYDQPSLRPTLAGWRRSLSWQLARAQERAAAKKDWTRPMPKNINGAVRNTVPNHEQTQQQIRLIREPGTSPPRRVGMLAQVLKKEE